MSTSMLKTLFVFLLLRLSPLMSRAQSPAMIKVGLIVDADSPVGRIASTTIPMALADFYASSPNSSTLLQLISRDAGGDTIAATSAALELIIKEEVHAILGPQSSVESAFVADLGTRSQVPIISFSATSPSVSSSSAKFFVRAALDDAAQSRAIAALVTHFGWRRAVPIYEDSDYGAAFVPFLVDALNDVGAEIPYRCALPATARHDAVSAALYGLNTEQTRVFVVHTRPQLAKSVFAAASDAGMMAAGYAWIITDGLTSLLSCIDLAGSMQGVLGLAPHVPTTPRLHEFKKRWARQFLKDHPAADPATAAEFGSYGVWAYDAAWAVASAAERLGPRDLAPGITGGSSGPTDFANLGTSRSGKKILDSILSTKFDGLGGKFELVGGELDVTAFRIVNIMENRKERGIGFWTQHGGLTRRLGLGLTESDSGLAPVIWPGESTVVPKGWDQPMSGRKLRIAVPGIVDPGYRPILYLDTDPTTNRTVAGGFVIDVFEAAVRLLPYALPFVYVLVKPLKYDVLVQEVANGAYDAAVADITITANRSMHVDFTLPYMVSDISMVVPMHDQRSKKTWVFLKPLKLDLWLVSLAFFVFTGFAVWAVEHRINEEFRGPPSNQLGTLFYFGFSTLVFAHRENVRSNLSRFIVIVWVFVVLILQSSYTASLTSMLTVQQLEPTMRDYRDLWKSKENIGIMSDSFMRGTLTKIGFPSSRLVSYRSMQSFQEALSNGTIGAIVDETPYLKLFLKTYCDNYKMTGQTNKTGGLGFAFPTGSPLVADLSRAILNLTEGDELDLIERKWFGDTSNCPTQDNSFSSNSLSFESFWGLFLITGATSLLCCIVHLATFVSQNRRPLREIASDMSWKGKLRRVAKLFDDKDLSAHTFRKDQPNMDGSVTVRTDPSVSPGAHNVGSPFSVSNHTFGEWSIGTASPATVEIEFARPAEEVACQPVVSAEDDRGQNN